MPALPIKCEVVDMTTTEGVEAARRAIGRQALEKAFGPGGGGVSEIIDNIKKAHP